MSQSLAKIYLHCIFSPKNRDPWISRELAPHLHAYMAVVLDSLDSPAILIGGMPDHIHILCALSKNLSPANLIEKIKIPSSKWLKRQGAAYGKF